MRVYVPLLALLLLGASPACPTAPLSAGIYGYLGYVAPPPEESVSIDAQRTTVSQALGDRMFTAITATYDAKTFALLSLHRHASCCGSAWSSDVSRNADGSYDIEAQMRSGPDVYKESRTHFDPVNAEINAGGFFIIPWVYHVNHVPQIVQLTFSPIHADFFTIEKADAAPYPDDVPNGDNALVLKASDGKPAMTLWYDPCTFTLDAYGSREGVVWVRTAAL
jgi:hypothetical protein